MQRSHIPTTVTTGTLSDAYKYKSIQTLNELPVHEPAMEYQRRNSEQGVTRMTTQAELETECFSLEESKQKLIEKIHCHYSRQS